MHPRSRLARSGRHRAHTTRVQGANLRTLDADCPVQEGTGRTQPTSKEQDHTPSTQIGLPTMVPQALIPHRGRKDSHPGAKQVSQDRTQPT
ncbi:hypothetical protein CLV65_0480 [Pseudoscardovia suis]|uniref:Uncharacterized protein n=1 Tax=Pseudoscardovia suis TaxID=987063 RepID=A0A261ES30_9BIFI|nr:hypothetical protein PSSU_1469 [Pseudoscardovia suis]PJJ69764.1 hypothetical protein CLV65_0480 [Pseudoscardovia suis]